MKKFIEKWNSDSKFKIKVKLSLYTLFVILVSIFAISSKNNIPEDTLQDEYNKGTQGEKIDNPIKIPNEYNYKINVTINENNYQYTGNKDNLQEKITKDAEGIITNYIYKNNNYYKEYESSYILSTKDEVYDIVNYDYIKLETINEYLLKSTKKDNKYILYLKDVILGNDSEEYITITKEENKVTIDYTSLMKNFDKTIFKYLVKIEIE